MCARSPAPSAMRSRSGLVADGGKRNLDNLRARLLALAIVDDHGARVLPTATPCCSVASPQQCSIASSTWRNG